jgi:hypothetical protein
MKTRPAILLNLTTAAAVAAAAIFSGSGPVQAGDKDLFKLLAGVAAVAVIASAVNQNQRRAAGVSRNQPLNPFPRIPGTQAEDYWQNQSRDDDGYTWNSRSDRRGPRIPAACALEFDGGPRPVTYYAETCLKREGVSYALPQYCAEQIRSRDWQGRVYEAECLRDAGYRTERWAE